MSIILNNLKTEFFSNLNLDLKENEKIAIIGDNGVGKTTLLRTILGLIPYEGDIRILDKDIVSKKDFKEIYPNIGYLFQDSDDSFIAPSVLEEIAFNLYNKTEDLDLSMKKALELLEEFGLEDLKDKLPVKLSGGQKRIVALCATFIHSPKILLLDEPTNHLDEKFTNLVEEKIKKFDGNIVLVVHNIEFAKKVVDKFYKLTKNGLEIVNI